jgi:potassium uptake TrkH family protein
LNAASPPEKAPVHRWTRLAVRLSPAAKLLVGAAALGMFLAVIGFLGEVPWPMHLATIGLGLLFLAGESRTLRRCGSLKAYGRTHPFPAALAAAVIPTVAWLILARMLPGQDDDPHLLAHGVIQGAVLLALLTEAIRHQSRWLAAVVHPGWLLIASFAVTIAAGSLLLKMPKCVVPGEQLSWLDAVFTSTSAVCVTGLTVENTATFFSPTGQFILLGLIQVGGLGIMTLTYFIATLLFQGMSLHDRYLLSEMLSEKSLARVGKTLRFIVLFTLASEIAGALLLAAVLPPGLAPADRVFQSVFHAVSAFCNAGFSTFPNGLAETSLAGNFPLQAILCVLIILGGLGAVVVSDLHAWTRARLRRFRDPAAGTAPPRLKVHTRLALSVTGLLLAGGTLLAWVSEFLLHRGPTNAGPVATAFFHSVTARTAGFNTVDMGAIGPLTIHLLVALMFIGGSPGGTAGGVRTTVAGAASVHLWNQFRRAGGPIMIFRRGLPERTGPRALAILVLSVGWLFVNFAWLRQLHPAPEASDTRLVFELVSAFATVGLSLNLTPELTEGARIVLILNMFVGRIGLFTVCAALVPGRRPPRSAPPEEDILLT